MTTYHARHVQSEALQACQHVPAPPQLIVSSLCFTLLSNISYKHNTQLFLQRMSLAQWGPVNYTHACDSVLV